MGRFHLMKERLMKFEAMNEDSLKMILRILLFYWRVVKAEVSELDEHVCQTCGLQPAGHQCHQFSLGSIASWFHSSLMTLNAARPCRYTRESWGMTRYFPTSYDPLNPQTDESFADYVF